MLGNWDWGRLARPKKWGAAFNTKTSASPNVDVKQCKNVSGRLLFKTQHVTSYQLNSKFMLSVWLTFSSVVQMDKRKEPSSVDIKSVLLDMRKYRMGLIQTPDQLRFSYMAVLEGAKYIVGDPAVQVTAPQLPIHRRRTINHKVKSTPLHVVTFHIKMIFQQKRVFFCKIMWISLTLLWHGLTVTVGEALNLHKHFRRVN